MYLFILFGGYRMAEELWNYDLNSMKKTGFLEKIKKIGDVICYYPNFYNIAYYFEEPSTKKFYDKTLDFSI